MWTHVSLNAHVVWEDALWTVVAVWQEDPGVEPLTLERSGRVPLTGDWTPEAVLAACVDGMRREAAITLGEQLGD